MVTGLADTIEMVEIMQVVTNIRPQENFKVQKIDMRGVEDNVGVISVFPENPEHGQITISYFAKEREAVILAKSDAAYEFGHRIWEGCALEIPGLDCSGPHKE